MLTTTLGLLALMLPAPEDTSGELRSSWLFNGCGQPIVVEAVGVAPESAELSLVLLGAHGEEIAPPRAMKTPRVDLTEFMPEVSALRRTAYLQLRSGEQAIGSALVLQPMLSRQIPQTEEALAPSGMTYTKITGWYDELHPPRRPELAPGSTPPEATADGAPMQAEPATVEPLCTGLRIYPERDVMLVTTLGEIRIALRPDEAPNTAWNFRALAEGGFYRGVAFHRIVPLDRRGLPFVIQAGDPTGTGDGGPGYWLPIEPSRLPHALGVISMARDIDPDSGGSQFFFGLSRAGTARLDGSYCAFGVAIEGIETIRRIAAVKLADVEAGRPETPPVITEARLVPSAPRREGEARGVPQLEDGPAPGDATNVPR